MGSARETTAGLEPRIKVGVGYGDFSKFWSKNQFQELVSRGYIKGEGWKKEKKLRGEEEKYLGKTDDQAYFYSILFF